MGLALKTLTENSMILLGVLLFFTISIICSSCTVISKDIDKRSDLNADNFEPQKTHYRNIVATLGPPSKLSKYGGGLVFLYESVDINERQIGLNFNYNILKLLKFSVARGTADRELLVLIFNPDGYLAAKSYKSFKENLGSGQAISYLFNIEQLVDSSKLEERPSALSWASNLLKPIPENLNNAQNLGTGQSGLEQLGVTNRVGQHTLEMAE